MPLISFRRNVLGAPQRIFPRHSSDQFPDFSAQARPAKPRARPLGPVPAPTPAMPADHRSGLRDPQVTRPTHRPEPTHPDPWDPVPVAQARLWLAAQQHLDLVSRDQVLERKVLAGKATIHKDPKHLQSEIP